MNDIRTRVTIAVAAAAFAIAALAGCAATTDTGSSTSGPAPSSAPAGRSTLTTAATSLGTVVVDGRGMTVYVFDHDSAGATSSSCTGACATTWPAVEADSTTPKVTGVTGTVGTITGVDGRPQVTLNGLPLYTFASDSAAGDVNGQGVGGIWWAVGSDGAKLGGGDDSPSHDATPDDSSTSGHKPGY